MDIGILGIGLMGNAFVERFKSQGHTVRIYNRTHDNIKDLKVNLISLTYHAIYAFNSSTVGIEYRALVHKPKHHSKVEFKNWFDSKL